MTTQTRQLRYLYKFYLPHYLGELDLVLTPIHRAKTRRYLIVLDRVSMALNADNVRLERIMARRAWRHLEEWTASE